MESAFRKCSHQRTDDVDVGCDVAVKVSCRQPRTVCSKHLLKLWWPLLHQEVDVRHGPGIILKYVYPIFQLVVGFF